MVCEDVEVVDDLRERVVLDGVEISLFADLESGWFRERWAVSGVSYADAVRWQARRRQVAASELLGREVLVAELEYYRWDISWMSDVLGGRVRTPAEVQAGVPVCVGGRWQRGRPLAEVRLEREGAEWRELMVRNKLRRERIAECCG